MKADSYYGDRVRTYDADRCNTLRWAIEQGAVADFVTEAPVLDCPLGTGRYVGIYRDRGLGCVGVDISADMVAEARRKHPGLYAIEASVFDLPFGARTFATAVCTRLLDWLSPEEMAAAVAELRRVADALVISIRHGVERVDTNQTHDLAKFYKAVDGLFIAGRRVTDEWHGDTEEILFCRPPVWGDVLKQFEHHGHTPEFELHRLASDWFAGVDLTGAAIRAGYWTSGDLFAVVEEMAADHDHGVDEPSRYVTSEAPRFTDGPVTLLRMGRTVVLDGRRRVNQWRGTAGLYPVLVVECGSP